MPPDGDAAAHPREGRTVREYPAREPVPAEHRNIGFAHMLAIWTGANANNGSWYVGGVAAGAAFGGAALATLTANPLAYAVMALIGLMGFRAGVSTMALTRPALGGRGSLLPSLLNAIQLIGWCAVNTFIAAISVTHILHAWLGTPAYGDPGGDQAMLLGIGLMSALNLVSVAGGHRSVKLAECVGTLAILGLGLWETVAVLRAVPLADILHWHPPAGKALALGQVVDAMAAFSLGWVPVIADFTRYCRTRAAATWAPVLGANLGLFWFAFVGILCTIAAAVTTGTYDPNLSDPSSIASQLGLGAVAFGLILLASATTNAINILGAGISLTNCLPKLKPLPTVWAVALAASLLSCVPLFLSSLLDSFILFLDGVGMVFGPLFGILLADRFLLRRPYDPEAFRRDADRGFKLAAFAAWGLAVGAFLLAGHLGIFEDSVGRTFPALVLAGLLYALFSRPRANAAAKSR